jgi:hypothetical protein
VLLLCDLVCVRVYSTLGWQLAGFRVSPNRGRLQPLQSQNVLFTFAPGQLGNYTGTIHLVVGDRLHVVPIRVVGRCIGGPDGAVPKPGASATAELSTSTTGSMFSASLKFVPQADTTVKTEADVARITAMLESAGFKDSIVLGPVGSSGGPPKEAGSTFVRPKPWEHVLAQDNVTVDTVPTADKYTGTIRDLQKVRGCLDCLDPLSVNRVVLAVVAGRLPVTKQSTLNSFASSAFTVKKPPLLPKRSVIFRTCVCGLFRKRVCTLGPGCERDDLA